MAIPKIVRVSINLDKIDEKYIVNGKKGRYLNVALINTPDSPYGNDYMASQDLPKEARENGERGQILGNAQAWNLGEGTPATKQDTAPKGGGAAKGDDLPF